MCYTGYNVEDAVLINEGSLKRGLFRTTYYTTYESHEEKSKTGMSTVDKVFTNIENEANVVGTKPGYDYSKLDKYGLIRENTQVDDKTVLIGLTSMGSENKTIRSDESKVPKKGQLGIVDKSFITDGEEGFRIAKIRIREERIPTLGDKMACALPTQQVLTNIGWIEIKDIDINIHKVATLDTNGNMCYEYPVNKFEYDHNGKMYYVKNKQVHLICTLNHKLYVKKRCNKKYELIESKDIIGKMVRFKKSMSNIEPDIEWMNIDEKQYKMDDWLQLLGMFISDGSVNNRAVVLSCHKQRKVDFNTNILKKLNLEYKHDTHHGYFALNKGKYPEIYRELKKYSLGALKKYLPEYVWNLSQRQSIILMEALLQGDGHTYKDGFSRYGTISIKLANDISRLAVRCGWSGIIKIAEEPGNEGHNITGTMGYNKDKTHIINVRNTYYKISIIRKQNEPYINKKVNGSNEEKLIDYEGKVYCIEMPSSNLYYMRENIFTASMLIGNSRSGQKGTVGLVIPEQDMPFGKDGIRPDIIINPHAIPTRMTIGQLVESITGKACVCYGGFGDCTAFNNEGSKIKIFGEMLADAGYHSSGNEVLYNGMTGEQIETEIFMGPTFYMRLKHMVKDKINYRASGPRTALTRQAVSGRANDGGLRIGEMERDSVISHGISEFLRESMMERGDKYQMAICNNTGTIAIYNQSKNIFMSPLADGPIKFVGSLDNKDTRIETVTKFGRNFSIVNIPYSMKLLMQELQTMNVQMRIITEDNIQQLENLSYSKNIEKLVSVDKLDAKSIINAINNNLIISTKNQMNQIPNPTLNQNDEFKILSELPENAAELPEYAAASPEYAAASPEYAAASPELPVNWVRKFNDKYKTYYYFNIVTGESQWDIPVDNIVLPENWVRKFNDKYKTYYYFNIVTGKSQWEIPTKEPSPEFVPTSPENSPPPPTPLQTIPASSPSSPPPSSKTEQSQNPLNILTEKAQEYTVNDNVHYNGDSVPTRIWNVRSIGDRTITIETDNMENLEMGENIKVVTANDIYPIGNYSSPLPQPQMPNLQTGGFNNGLVMNPYMQGGYETPNINFAPNIKIVTGGSDFSTGGESDNVANSNIGPSISTHQQPEENGLIVQKGGTDTEKSGLGLLDFGKSLFGKITKLN